MGAPRATRLTVLVAALIDDLTTARRRGLDELDLRTDRLQPVPLPELERLARRYTGSRQPTRVPLIRRLLEDALTAWGQLTQHADDAAFMRELFFGAPGLSRADRRPTKLEEQAMQRRGLTEDALDARLRGVFRLFARFLVGFVAEPAPRPRLPVLRWLVAAVLLAIVALVAVLLSVRSPGSGSEEMLRSDALGGGSAVTDVYPGV